MSFHYHNNRIGSVLSFFPNTNGVGYSFFQSSMEFHQAAMMTARVRNTVDGYIERMKEKVLELNPSRIIFPDLTKKQGKRIPVIMKAIHAFADKQDIPVYCYSQEQVRLVFAQYDLHLYHEIGDYLACIIPGLAEYTYDKREYNKDEPYRSAMMKSAILGLVHGYFED